MPPKTWLSCAISLSTYSTVIFPMPLSNANGIVLLWMMPSNLNCFLSFDAMTLRFIERCIDKNCYRSYSVFIHLLVMLFK